ncbi:MAG: RuBisCO large subunit C-terminal-like domain-containing protein [Pseudomonadota bacterium]
MIERESRILVQYQLDGTAAPSADDARELARIIALEQTVELPDRLVTDARIREDIVGRVERLTPGQDGTTLATISFSTDLGQLHLSALINLLYGNVSIFEGVRLTDLHLPPALLDRFRGPTYGIHGIRALTGVYGRPLLATALKPNGASAQTLATMAADFARGGGDIVKDDQNLIDDLETFKRRVSLIAERVEAVNQSTGRRCLYLPHVAAGAAGIRHFMEFVRDLGLPGVLVCPLIAGLDTCRELCAELDLVQMAHPSLTGTFTNPKTSGIDHGVLLGTLFRLGGADISIFPNAGGRFTFSHQTCAAIAQRLQEPLGDLAPVFPSPGGGMHFDNLPQMFDAYGEDAVLLVGGGLLGLDPDLTTGTRAFAERIADYFPDHRQTPPTNTRRPLHQPVEQRHHEFLGDYAWHERPSSEYKSASDSSFKDVRRVELVGRYGERTHSDLRYFEVAPGGYSSREFHQHTHIVIGARGEGVLVRGNDRRPLREHDIAYIEPLEVHQLLNETDEPFGFYCIVDHERDRPERV